MSTLLFNAGLAASWMRASMRATWLSHLNRAILRVDGQSGPPSQTDNTTRILLIIVILVVGLPALCVCVSVVVIAILTLLGPSIGNVFSGINDNLQNP